MRTRKRQIYHTGKYFWSLHGIQFQRFEKIFFFARKARNQGWGKNI